MPFHIVLHRPEIPQNTGAIIRLSANTGATLHLVKPLGFELDDTKLRRAGLDYHEWASMQVHETLADCLEVCGTQSRVWAFSTHGQRQFADARFAAGDVFLFGGETSGLPLAVTESFAAEHLVRLPMQPHSRSLNLANTVAVVTYEAWRQIGFPGGQ